jgi:hypothetical protein
MYELQGRLAIINKTDVDRIIIAGDIHGDLPVFRRIMTMPGPDDLLVFLGDYADRGSRGVEVLEALINLSARQKARIIALKGNHEDFSEDGRPKFHPCTLIQETISKGRRWEKFFEVLKPFLDERPLAAIIPGLALLVHGGISRSIDSPASLANPTAAIENDVLWSDPDDTNGVHANPRGAGCSFGPDVTELTLRACDVEYLIRSHEPQKAIGGPFAEHDGKVITTSSTGVYGGRPFVLVLDRDILDMENISPAVSCEFLD